MLFAIERIEGLVPSCWEGMNIVTHSQNLVLGLSARRAIRK